MYPNPTSDGLVTLIDQDLEEGTVLVLNSAMHLVHSTTLADHGQGIVNLRGLPDGAYLLLLRSEQETRTVRVVKATAGGY